MKKTNKSNKKILIILLFLFIIGFALRIFLTTCYYWDELSYLQNSEILSGKVNNYNEFDFRPPLISVIISGLYLIWHNPLIANLFVSLLASLSIIFIYLLGKEMFNDKVGIIASIILTLSPIHIYFSKTLLVHTTAIFFTLVALFFLKKGENTKKSYLFLLAGIFSAFAILTRFTYLALIPILIINLIIFKSKYDFKKIIFLIIGLAIPLLPYLIWSQITYRNPLYTFQTGQLMANWSSRESWFFYLKVLPLVLSVIGILGIILWLFFKIKNKKIPKQEIFILSWIIFPFIYLSLMTHKEIRFLLITLIPMIIIASIGIYSFYKKIKDKKIFLAVFIILLILPLLFKFPDLYPRTCDSDAQFTAKWIMNNTEQNKVLYAQEEFTALAYYTDRKIILAPFDKTRFLDKNASYMDLPGYYIYFEKQNRTESFPKIEEIDEDSRFKLIEILQNKEKIYVYWFKGLN
jgi:4-amino-4-deoxy-L-arabinose transferase-like glycosyltransferase